MDGMNFTIPKKKSQQEDPSPPPAAAAASPVPAQTNEATVLQVNAGASKPPPPAVASRPATRGKLLPSAVNSKNSCIHIKSENPFIIKINVSQIPLDHGSINTPSRGSGRKRKASRKYDDSSPAPSEASSSRKSSSLLRSSSFDRCGSSGSSLTGSICSHYSLETIEESEEEYLQDEDDDDEEGVPQLDTTIVEEDDI